MLYSSRIYIKSSNAVLVLLSNFHVSLGSITGIDWLNTIKGDYSFVLACFYLVLSVDVTEIMYHDGPSLPSHDDEKDTRSLGWPRAIRDAI
jgi:hypothetical protein